MTNIQLRSNIDTEDLASEILSLNNDEIIEFVLLIDSYLQDLQVTKQLIKKLKKRVKAERC